MVGQDTAGMGSNSRDMKAAVWWVGGGGGLEWVRVVMVGVTQHPHRAIPCLLSFPCPAAGV